jgi:hypothetical protein
MHMRRKLISGVAVAAVCVVVFAVLLTNGDTASGVGDSKDATLSLSGYFTNQGDIVWASFTITNRHRWPIVCLVTPPWVASDGPFADRIQMSNPPRVAVAARGTATCQVPVPRASGVWRAQVLYEHSPSRLRVAVDWFSRLLRLPLPTVRPMPPQFIGYSSLIVDDHAVSEQR